MFNLCMSAEPGVGNCGPSQLSQSSDLSNSLPHPPTPGYKFEVLSDICLIQDCAFDLGVVTVVTVQLRSHHYCHHVSLHCYDLLNRVSHSRQLGLCIRSTSMADINPHSVEDLQKIIQSKRGVDLTVTSRGHCWK